MAIAVSAMFLKPSQLRAQEARVDSRGSVGIAGEFFSPDKRSETIDQTFAINALLEVRARKQWFRAKAVLSTRSDAFMPSRRFAQVEDAWLAGEHGFFQAYVGARAVNWSVMEVFHPADIVNARNFDSSVVTPSKRGEPSVELRFSLLSGTAFSFAYLPVRLFPRFPSEESRHNLFKPPAPEPVSTIDSPRWLDPDGSVGSSPWAHQGYFRVTQQVGGGDISGHVVLHYDRTQPRVLPTGPQAFRMVFQRTLQAGFSWAHVLDAFVLKIESAYRHFPDRRAAQALGLQLPDHAVLAYGFEYGFVFPESDGAAMVEFQGVLGPPFEQTRTLQVFQNDVFVGYRHTWFDTAGTTLFAGVVLDYLHPTEFMPQVLFQRRFFDTWRAEAGARYVHAPRYVDPTPATTQGPLQGAHNDVFLRLNLVRSF